MLLGSPILMGDSGGIVLTAGQQTTPGSGDVYVGYTTEDAFSQVPAFGSLSDEPVQGAVVLALYQNNDDNGSSIDFYGNQETLLAAYTGVEVNSVKYSLNAPFSYSGSSVPPRTRGTISGLLGFVSGQQYRIRLV